MKRFLLAIGAAFAALFAFAGAPSFAAIIELGTTTTPLAKPVCPATGGCPIILTKTTALQIQSDGTTYPTMAAHTGRIVAFTVTPATVSSADINGTPKTSKAAAQPGLNATYGGPSEAAITVLQASSKHFYKVVAESPMFQLQPYFGHLVQFVLDQSLPIAKGQFVALTVPTWAPLLTVNLTKSMFLWRPSRATGCLSYTVQSAQLTIGNSAQYLCFFTGTRVDYTATEITSPVPPPQPKKRTRKAKRR
ncbi:MAG TPA: hypothetical protein VG388_13065 [Solirubrobacteraceae bacterium]|nr:hypothetical protein [Solirubrobacteraceae bacterium]